MNLPNTLTILRIFLVVPFLILMALFVHQNETLSYQSWNLATTFFFTSMLIFIVAMASDALDGYLARKNQQITTFGKLFDPLADKFMTTSAFVMLTIAQIVPFWVTIIFILRDILVDGSRNLAAKNNLQVSASLWGKWKTMLQSLGLILIFLIMPLYQNWGQVLLFYCAYQWRILLLEIPIILALCLSLISGFKYFSQVIPYLRNN